MTINYQWMRNIEKLGLLLMMGVSMSADAELFGFGSTSWKEEALQNDGARLLWRDPSPSVDGTRSGKALPSRSKVCRSSCPVPISK